MKTKQSFTMINIILLLLFLGSCSDNNLTEEEIIIQFIESALVEGDYEKALELSSEFTEGELRKKYNMVDSGFREKYKKVNIYYTSSNNEYLVYIPHYRIMVTLGLTQKDEELIDKFSIDSPTIEKLEKTWKNHNWDSTVIRRN